jgi:hypothetical protein
MKVSGGSIGTPDVLLTVTGVVARFCAHEPGGWIVAAIMSLRFDPFIGMVRPTWAASEIVTSAVACGSMGKAKPSVLF